MYSVVEMLRKFNVDLKRNTNPKINATLAQG